jgi:G3E family GTPase
VVNDFGAINIDAELITGASNGVVSLSNGCICCSLEGDLLRTLATLLRRDPRPALYGDVPAALLFSAEPDRVLTQRDPGPRRPAADRFETLSWTSEQPVSLPRLEQAIGRLAPKLARAKGLFETVEQPGRLMVFQFAGGRATLAPDGTPAAGMPRARFVFIAEIGALTRADIDTIMDGCVVRR